MDAGCEKTEADSLPVGEFDRVLGWDLTSRFVSSLVSDTGAGGNTLSWNRSHKSGRYGLNLYTNYVVTLFTQE